MKKTAQFNANKLRAIQQRIAQIAAQIAVTQSIDDLHSAKLKAASQLNQQIRREQLPTDEEVELAIREYRMLFGGNQYASTLDEKYKITLRLLELFSEFSPRVTGAIVSGNVDDSSIISLHLHSDAPEPVYFFIEYHGIRTKTQYVHAYLAGNPSVECTLYRFHIDQQTVEALVLPQHALRQPPLKENLQPMPRWTLAQLLAHLNQ